MLRLLTNKLLTGAYGMNNFNLTSKRTIVLEKTEVFDKLLTLVKCLSVDKNKKTTLSFILIIMSRHHWRKIFAIIPNELSFFA